MFASSLAMRMEIGVFFKFFWKINDSHTLNKYRPARNLKSLNYQRTSLFFISLPPTGGLCANACQGAHHGSICTRIKTVSSKVGPDASVILTKFSSIDVSILYFKF